MRFSPASRRAEHLGQLAIGGRPRDQRDVGRALEDLFAFLLGDAAEHAEALAGLVQLLVVVEAVEDLLLGLVADGAGVVEDQAGVFFGLDLAVALLQQCANHLFGVMGIHLAAEGLKIEGFFGCHGKFEYRAFRSSESSPWSGGSRTGGKPSNSEHGTPEPHSAFG